MSVNVHVYVMIGILEDFALYGARKQLVTVAGRFCENAHRATRAGAFCPTCGTKVTEKTVQVPELRDLEEVYGEGFARKGNEGVVVLGLTLASLDPMYGAESQMTQIDLGSNVTTTLREFLTHIGRPEAEPSLFVVTTCG